MMPVSMMIMLSLLVARTAAKVATASSVGSVANSLYKLEDTFTDLEDIFDGGHIHISSDVVEAATEVTVKQLVLVVKFLLDLGTFFVVVGGAHRLYRNRFLAKDADAAPEQAATADFGALLDAARAGKEDCWRKLLQAPYAVLEEDSCGCTALHAAAEKGFADLAQALIEYGAVLDATDVQGETPLHVAARAGQVDVIKLLVDNGAYIDAVNGDVCTPLLAAALADKADACDLLLDHGATVGNHSLSEDELPPLLRNMLVRRLMQ